MSYNDYDALSRYHEWRTHLVLEKLPRQGTPIMMHLDDPDSLQRRAANPRVSGGLGPVQAVVKPRF